MYYTYKSLKMFYFKQVINKTMYGMNFGIQVQVFF